VIARLVVIHIILPNQFESLCENGNLRVAVILFGLSRLRFLRECARESAKQQTNQQWDDHHAPHISSFNPRFEKPIIAHEEFLATAKAEGCLS
jgi:hypothetical protein